MSFLAFKNRRRLLLGLTLLVLLASLFALPSVHWCVIGWVKGEAFYQGRPTSYWAQEIENDFFISPIPHNRPTLWYRQLTFLEDVQQRLQGDPTPTLESSDASGVPVLLALLNNDSAKVRRFVIHVLTSDFLSENPGVVDALLEATHDSDNEVRLDAIAALRFLNLGRETAPKAGVH